MPSSIAPVMLLLIVLASACSSPQDDDVTASPATLTPITTAAPTTTAPTTTTALAETIVGTVPTTNPSPTTIVPEVLYFTGEDDLTKFYVIRSATGLLAISPNAGSGTDGSTVATGTLVQAVEAVEIGDTTWVRVLEIEQAERGAPTATPLGWVTAADLDQTSQAIYAIDGDIEGRFARVVDVTDDDTLNVRRGPGISEDILTELFPGEVVLHSGEVATIPSGDAWVRILHASTSTTLGWVNAAFLRDLSSVDVWPLVSNSDGSPATSGFDPAYDHGTDSRSPSLIGLACNGAQLRLSSTASSDDAIATLVRIGPEEPRGVVTADAPTFVDWQLGDTAIDVSIPPGDSVLVTLPTDGSTWHLLDLGPELESDVLVSADAQPIKNDDGTFIAAKRKRFTAPDTSC